VFVGLIIGCWVTKPKSVCYYQVGQLIN